MKKVTKFCPVHLGVKCLDQKQNANVGKAVVDAVKSITHFG